MTIEDKPVALPPTEIPVSVRRTLLMLLGCVVFVVAGVLLLVTHSSVKGVIGGALAVPFFGLCGVMLGMRLVKRAPELVITDEGISHRTLGAVSWEQVAFVAVRTVTVRTTSQQMIEVVLHDPAAYLATASKFVRAAGAGNARMGYGPYQISANTMGVSLEEIIAEMVKHRPSLQVAPAR